MTLIQARFIKFTVLILCCVIYALFFHYYAGRYDSLVSGCTLLVSLGFLMGLSIVRQMPFFSIFNARFWAQLHIYLGLFALAIFLLHVDHGWPHTTFNIILFIFFLLMIVTGIAGVYIYRRLPRKIVHFGDELVLSEIPARYRYIREQAESALKHACEHEPCDELSQFYLDHLYEIFKGPRQLGRSMCGLRSEQQVAQLRELERLKRYADSEEFACLERLQQLLEQKYDLDFYYAQKLLLRYWLYIHIPVAYGLCLLVIAHVVIVWLYFYNLI